jgi:hypothetical protein
MLSLGILPDCERGLDRLGLLDWMNLKLRTKNLCPASVRGVFSSLHFQFLRGQAMQDDEPLPLFSL